VSREIHPQQSAVVTIGTFHAGLKENVIADQAEFTLNIRTVDPQVRDQVNAALRRIINAEAVASGAPPPTVEELYNFPLNTNDVEQTAELLSAFKESFGAEQVSLMSPVMGSDDFGLLARAINVPSVYWFFGGHSAETLRGDKPVPVHHSSSFVPTTEPTMSMAVEAALTAILAKVGS
jgi:metal-dependent amidase/aminoacylase/carboxypeptidase family protein